MISPQIALLADQVQEIANQLYRNTHQFLRSRQIDVQDRTCAWVLNRQTSSFLNRWNRLTNGLTIAKHNGVIAFPLTYIPDYGATERDPPKIENADLIEKVPGVRLIVSFPTTDHRSPSIITPSAATFHHPPDHDLARYSSILRALCFYVGDVDKTFTFVGRDCGVILVGMREMGDYSEADEVELDHLAARLGCGRPKRWLGSSWDNIYRLMATEAPDCREMILRCRQGGERAILKKKAFLPRFLRRKLTVMDVVEFWRKRRTAELVLYVPQAHDWFVQLDTLCQALAENVMLSAQRWCYCGLSKEELWRQLSTSEEPIWKHRLILRLATLTRAHWEDNLLVAIRNFAPKLLIKLFHLTERTWELPPQMMR